LAFTVGTCTWAQVERLVGEAIVRFDPDLAEAQREEAADHRHFDIGLDQAGVNGLVPVHGLMDASDAGDLDDAIARRATLMGRLGHEGSLDVRRSEAVGEMARHDLTLDLEIVDEDTGEVTISSPGRKAEVHVHITDTTLTGDNPVGRNETTQAPVIAQQIREWLQTCGTITVRPVIDVNGHVPVDSYEIPDRLRRQVVLRDHHCRFPGCGRRAKGCDLDHAAPHADGGPTCPCNLVALCRRHHRAKTFSGWRYAIVQPGTYLWLSPNSRHFLVDHHGTRALDPPRRLDPPTVDQLHDYETEWPTAQAVPPCPGQPGHPPDQ
jgi:5-methylcytosine-specific restriction endonuclease McrA